MHPEPYNLVKEISEKFPTYFQGKKVLEVGSLDINGSVRGFFKDCEYVGIDVGEGKGVDVVCPGEDYIHPNEYDVVISTECLEHARNWQGVIQEMFNNTKHEGIIIFSCAGPSRQEHGVGDHTPQDSPYTTDYYENRTIEDLRSIWEEELFEFSYCYYLRGKADLIFWGIKK